MGPDGTVERTKWPFMFVVDANGEPTDWIVLHAPIQSASRKRMFADYRRRGLGFIGMTSFMTFPCPDHADPLDYDAVCEAWCHCFDQPDRFLPPHQPRTELALSDFTDPDVIGPERLDRHFDDVPPFDFVYIGADRRWKMAAKNWPLARACLPELCDRLRLRGLVIGVPADAAPHHPRLTVCPRLPYRQFLHVLARSGCLFVPNEFDASPRVLAEALCLDVPLVVNHALIGGRRYVTPETGVGFEGAHDVAAAVAACRAGSFGPRAWFCEHSGPTWAGRRLEDLIRRLSPWFDAPGPLSLSYER